MVRGLNYANQSDPCYPDYKIPVLVMGTWSTLTWTAAERHPDPFNIANQCSEVDLGEVPHLIDSVVAEVDALVVGSQMLAPPACPLPLMASIGVCADTESMSMRMTTERCGRPPPPMTCQPAVTMSPSNHRPTRLSDGPAELERRCRALASGRLARTPQGRSPGWVKVAIASESLFVARTYSSAHPPAAG